MQDIVCDNQAIESPQAQPRVSVLLPVYNAQQYLAQALDSMLAQTFTDFECICIDDGSADGSLALLERYAQRDSRIVVISRPNTGICGALNDGLTAARGQLIARMDADDTCHPARFAKQVTYLDNHADCVAVGTWVQRTDPFGSPAGTEEPSTDHQTIDQRLLAGDGGAMVHATLMMRADALRSVGGWRDKYNWVEDLDLFLRLAEFGQVANLPEHLYNYRRHVTSTCYQHNEVMRDRLKAVVAEAADRRGLGDAINLANLRPELQQGHTVGELYRNWACHAIHHSAGAIARKHALSAIRHSPWSIQSWRVLYWSMSA